MTTTAFEFNTDLVNVLRPLTNQSLNDFAEELMVLELYRRRQISSGKAAELLGMERMEFIRYSSRQRIAFFDMSDDEFAAEMMQVKLFLCT